MADIYSWLVVIHRETIRKTPLGKEEKNINVNVKKAVAPFIYKVKQQPFYAIA